MPIILIYLKLIQMKLALLLASALALLTQTEAHYSHRCTPNSPCDPGFICRNQRCVRTTPTSPRQCTRDGDCSSNPNGNYCRNFECVQCRSSSDCTFNPKGPRCNSNNQCGCSVGTDCGEHTYGPTCTSGSCQCSTNTDCTANSNGPTCSTDTDGKYCSCAAINPNSADCVGRAAGQSCRQEPQRLNDLDGRLTCGCSGTQTGCTTTNRLCSPVRNVCYCDEDQCPVSTPICSGNFLDRDALCVECRTNSDCSGTEDVCNNGSCVQCLTNADCSSFQSCNVATNVCQCNNARCGTSNPGFTCTAQTTTGQCTCNPTACTALSGLCVNDREVKCAKTCTTTTNFETTECPANQFCHNDGTRTVCRSNSISCLNGAVRDSSRCPTGLFCQIANTGSQQNSATCVPVCNNANDFCKGFDCPDSFKYAIAGRPCARDQDNAVDVCSCLDA